MKNVTWKNTLHDSRNLGSSIGEVAKICVQLGYPYMCWNDRIYAVSPAAEKTVLQWDDIGIIREQVDMNSKTKTGTVVVACRDSSGSPTMFMVDVQYTLDEYDEGIHYDRAEEKAIENGYEPPFLCYDESELIEITTMAQSISRLK